MYESERLVDKINHTRLDLHRNERIYFIVAYGGFTIDNMISLYYNHYAIDASNTVNYFMLGVVSYAIIIISTSYLNMLWAIIYRNIICFSIIFNYYQTSSSSSHKLTHFIFFAFGHDILSTIYFITILLKQFKIKMLCGIIYSIHFIVINIMIQIFYYNKQFIYCLLILIMYIFITWIITCSQFTINKFLTCLIYVLSISCSILMLYCKYLDNNSILCQFIYLSIYISSISQNRICNLIINYQTDKYLWNHIFTNAHLNFFKSVMQFGILLFAFYCLIIFPINTSSLFDFKTFIFMLYLMIGPGLFSYILYKHYKIIWLEKHVARDVYKWIFFNDNGKEELNEVNVIIDRLYTVNHCTTTIEKCLYHNSHRKFNKMCINQQLKFIKEQNKGDTQCTFEMVTDLLETKSVILLIIKYVNSLSRIKVKKIWVVFVYFMCKLFSCIIFPILYTSYVFIFDTTSLYHKFNMIIFIPIIILYLYHFYGMIKYGYIVIYCGYYWLFCQHIEWESNQKLQEIKQFHIVRKRNEMIWKIIGDDIGFKIIEYLASDDDLQDYIKNVSIQDLERSVVVFEAQKK